MFSFKVQNYECEDLSKLRETEVKHGRCKQTSSLESVIVKERQNNIINN